MRTRDWLALCGLMLVGAMAFAIWPALAEQTPINKTSPSYFSLEETSVGTTGLTTIGTTGIQYVQTLGTGQRLNIEICNADDDDALTAFEVDLLDHPDGEYYAFLSGTDWDTATSNMTFSTTTGPQEITTNGCAHAHINVRSAYRVRFRGTSAGTGAAVTVRGSITYD